MDDANWPVGTSSMDVNLDAYDIFPDKVQLIVVMNLQKIQLRSWTSLGISVVDSDRIIDNHNIILDCGDINIFWKF